MIELDSLLLIGGRGSFAKNAVMNAYSAVALSMRTSRADRTSASRGSFCHHTYIRLLGQAIDIGLTWFLSSAIYAIVTLGPSTRA